MSARPSLRAAPPPMVVGLEAICRGWRSCPAQPLADEAGGSLALVDQHGRHGVRMRLASLSFKNWRNFKSVDIPVGDRLLIVGPNASGKSNLLDGLRFLRDIADTGGGLQHAVETRGGMGRIRCLAARNFNHGRVGLRVELRDPGRDAVWSYELQLTAEPRGRRRAMVAKEIVQTDARVILERPDADDHEDTERLTQTALEQVNANREFRAVAEFLVGVRYRHLVPQIIRDPEQGQKTNKESFGEDFLVAVADTAKRTRDSRLRRVNSALRAAVPQIDALQLVRDSAGAPHLQARYQHWREQGAWQDERDLSDGTLRLIGLLWTLQDKSSKSNRVILLEEPELSLHAAVVRKLPAVLSRVTRRDGPQVILSTHSAEMLSDPGLGLDEVVVLSPDAEGTTAQMASEIEGAREHVDAGINLREILESRTQPAGIDQLPFFK